MSQSASTTDSQMPITPASTPWSWVRGFAILLGFLAAGEIIAPWLARIGMPLPGAVIGLVLLWAALRAGWVTVAQVADAARSLLVLMPLLFVPAGVGAFAGEALRGASGVRYVVAMVVLTTVMLGIVGWCAERWLRRGERTIAK